MPRGNVSGRLVAIDLMDRAIRAVEVNCTTAGLEVTGMASGSLPAPLGEMPPDEAGRALAQILREGRISARQAVVTIPRHFAVLKPLTVPPMEPRELLGSILLQAERELPFPVVEARVDCIRTGQAVPPSPDAEAEDGAGVPVLLGAVQRRLVNSCRALLEAAGLNVRSMGLRPCATANALVCAGAETADQFAALVDIGDAHTEISIVRDRHLIFSRSVSIGAAPEAEEVASFPLDDEVAVLPADEEEEAEAGRGLSLFRRWQEALIVEVRRSLEAFAVQPGGGPISALYLTGVGADDEDLAAAIAEALATRVAVIDPFDRVQMRGRARKAGPDGLGAFATALGAAIAESEALVPSFDFLTPLAERLRKPRSKRPYLVTALGLVALAAIIAGPMWLFRTKRDQIDRLADEIATAEVEAAQVEEIKQKADDLAPWADPEERVSWREVYLSLNDLWPDGRRAYLQSLKLRVDRRGKQISVSGRAQNQGVVKEILAALEKSADFRVLGAPTQRPTKDKYGCPVDFGMDAEWLGLAKRPAEPAGERPGPDDLTRAIDSLPTTGGTP